MKSNTIDGATFSTFTGISEFTLTVADPCLSAIVTAAALTSFTLKAYDALAEYSTFSDFSYTTATGFSSCGELTYSATIALGTSLNSLTSFAYN